MSFVAGLTTILLSWLALALVFAGTGFLAHRIFGRKDSTLGVIADAFWIGWGTIIVILQVWHLFLPINGWALALVAVLGIMGLALHRDEFAGALRGLRGLGWRFGLLLALGLVWLAGSAMGPPGPAGDCGLYHLPAVRWYLAFPAVPGLGNVHDRLGFNSSYFLYAALLDTGASPARCFHLANGLLVAALMAQLLLGLFSAARDWGHARLSDLLQALLIFPLFLAVRSPYFVNSIAPNVAIFVLGIVVGVRLLEFLQAADEDPQKLQRLYAIVFLSCVGITVKLSFLAFGLVASATALAIGFIRARKEGAYGLRKAGVLSFACAALPLAPWVIHGIILTGYAAFPSTVGALPVDWRVPRSVALKQQRLIYSWARKPWADPADVLGNWKWFRPWLRDNLPRPLIIGPCVLALLGGVFIIASWLRNRLIVRGRVWLFFLTPMAGLVFWFVMAPAPDFAGAGFVLLACGAVAFALAPHCEAAVRFLSSPGGRRILAWCCGLVICATVLLLISGKSAAMRTLRQTRSLSTAVACLGVNSEFVMGHPFYDRLQPAPRQPYKAYVTNSGLVVNVPTNDVFCWEMPLPSAPGPCPDLALRHEGRLQDGFVTRAKQDTRP